MPGTEEQGATTAASLFGVSKEAVSDDDSEVVAERDEDEVLADELRHLSGSEQSGSSLVDCMEAVW
jgi:hypothetical protein